MGIGLSGMVSGLDTDAIVKAMVSGQQAKATKIENKITLNKWSKEAWSGLNTKIYSFYTKYASKLRLQTSYMTRTASSSNESVVKATASSSAAVGTHKLQVLELASSQYVTGKQLAAARCNAKVAVKRVKNAQKKWHEAVQAYLKAEKHMRKMAQYYEDSVDRQKIAEAQLEYLVNTIKEG